MPHVRRTEDPPTMAPPSRAMPRVTANEMAWMPPCLEALLSPLATAGKTSAKLAREKIKNYRSTKIQQSESGFEYTTLVFGSDIDNSHKHAIKLQSFSYRTEKSGNSRRIDKQPAAVWTLPHLQISFKMVWVVLQVSVLLHATIQGYPMVCKYQFWGLESCATIRALAKIAPPTNLFFAIFTKS